MDTEPTRSAVPDVGALVEELRVRVEQRESEGYYPEALAQELHEHFRRITHRSVPDLEVLRRQLQALDEVAYFSPGRIPAQSTVPGGHALHAMVAKLVARQTQGILEQVQQFSDAVRAVLSTVLAALEEPHAHVHADLIGHVDALWERVASFERGPVDSLAAVAGLRSRVEVIEARQAADGFSPFFENARFEERFRGEHDALVDRYADLAKVFSDISPVLDIGCGRGEFLEVLRATGVEGTGVEVDVMLVEECRSRGLDVHFGDGLAYLSEVPDQSLGGISLIQVIEHLTKQQASDLVLVAHEKLRPGGRVVIETVNPESLYVFAHAFYLDPTHTQPVHPLYLRFLFEEAGFSTLELDWRSAVPEEEVLQRVPDEAGGIGEVLNANIDRLNRLLYGPQDYALIATR